MKKICTLLFGLFLFSSLIAQQPLKHTKKVYQAEDGKIYVQKSLPVYLYFSTEPNNEGKMYQLPSDSTPRYANPMYLDTEGYNSVRSPSAVDTVTKETIFPLTDVMFELYADSKPPQTKMNYDASKKYISEKKLYIGKNLKIDFSSWDEYSGIDQILVNIDSTGYKAYEDSIVLDKEKVYTIDYYAVDKVGNVEAAKSKVFSVDLTEPTTELVFENEKFENTISGKAKLVLKATDNISGVATIYFSLDGKSFQNYYYPINSVNLVEGEHNLKYYAVDRVGNVEQIKEFAFFVDKTPPILVDEIMGNSFVVNGKEYSSGRTKLKLTAVDNKAGVQEVKYSINNGEYVLYDKPFYLTTVSGSLSVISYAIDNVGNKSMVSEKSTKSRASYVDLTGPQLSHKFIGRVFKARDTTYINKDTKIQLAAFDTEAGLKSVAYSLNSADEIPYNQPFAIQEPGAYLLSIYGYDNVENSNREALSLVVDNMGPDIYSRFSVLPIAKRKIEGTEADIYPSHVVIFLSATDAKVAIDRIYYSVNGEKEVMFTGVIDGFKRGNDYNIEVRAYDKLGNVNVSNVIFGTDNSGPEVFTRFSVQPVANEVIDGEMIDVYPDHVSLFLSVTNAPIAYDRIYYSINKGKEQSYKGIIDGYQSGQIVTMHIRALDQLGNETKKEIKFKIEE